MDENQQSEFICGFCLEVTHGPFEPYPAKCEHCKVGRCSKCQTYLKHDPEFCYGCGAIKPEVKPHMSRSTNTSSMYASDGWMYRNLGPYLDPREPLFLATSIAPDKPRRFLAQRNPDTRKIEVFRALTVEEIALLEGEKVEKAEPRS